MATSKTTNNPYYRLNLEDTEFPIVCQTCLGGHPYARMTKEKIAKDCQICVRPFSVVRWCPGAGMAFRETEICRTCSRLDNVCQTCILDLDYGLPIRVRDAALRIKDELSRSSANREYCVQNTDTGIEKMDPKSPTGDLEKSAAVSDLLVKFRRNRPHICSLWIDGKCRSKGVCPYSSQSSR